MKKFGSIFKEKYGKDPRELTLKEIDEIAIKKKITKGYKPKTNIISIKENIYDFNYYDIDKIVDDLLSRKRF